MKGNSVLYKSLVVGVIVLFIGVGIQPAIALNESTSISDDEDDCDLCPKASKQHIVRFKGLIDRLDTLNTKLSKVSKLNPELEEKYQEISDKFSIIKELNLKLKQEPERIRDTDICDKLLPIVTVLSAPFFLLAFFVSQTDGLLGLKLLLIPFITVISIPAIIIGGIWLGLCYPGPT